MRLKSSAMQQLIEEQGHDKQVSEAQREYPRRIQAALLLRCPDDHECH